MLWKEKERSRIKVVQMHNLRGLLGIRRMDRVPNTQIRELHNDKRINEDVSGGLATWRGRRMIGLPGESM